jgi:hypothetical protein
MVNDIQVATCASYGQMRKARGGTALRSPVLSLRPKERVLKKANRLVNGGRIQLGDLEVAVCPIAPSAGVVVSRNAAGLRVKSGLRAGPDSQNNGTGGYHQY